MTGLRLTEAITKHLNNFQHDVKRTFLEPVETSNPTNQRDALVNSTKVNASNVIEHEFEIKTSRIPELPSGKSVKPRKSGIIDYNET